MDAISSTLLLCAYDWHECLNEIGDLRFHVTQVASCGELWLNLPLMDAIYAPVFCSYILSHSRHVLSLLCPLCQAKNATKFVRKDLTFVKLAWLSFISLYLPGCLGTLSRNAVSGILPTVKGIFIISCLLSFLVLLSETGWARFVVVAFGCCWVFRLALSVKGFCYSHSCLDINFTYLEIALFVF